MHTSLSHYLKSSLLPLWKEKGKSQNKMFSLIQPSNFMPNQILNSDHARQLSDPTHRNMAYIVYYIYCHNAIAVHHAAIHTDASKAKTFQEVIKYPNRKRHKPSLKTRDNACSKADKAYINEQDVNIQFDSPRNYRLNAAEQIVTKFKNIFIEEVDTLNDGLKWDNKALLQFADWAQVRNHWDVQPVFVDNMPSIEVLQVRCSIGFRYIGRL